MRWSLLCAMSVPLVVSSTGLAGSGRTYAAPAEALSEGLAVTPQAELSLPHVQVKNDAVTSPDDAHASELEDRYCKTPLAGANPCGEAFDLPANAVLLVTLVSAKGGGENNKDGEFTVAVHDDTHKKEQVSFTLKWGNSFVWKNKLGELMKVQLKAKAPTRSMHRDIHLRYKITE